MKSITSLLILTLLLFQHWSIAQVDHSKCGNHVLDYAPIDLMGTHIHVKGGLMMTYRYMNMSMKDMMQGSSAANDMEIFQSYMVAPQSMSMQMHMLSAMYAPTDKLTFMVMINCQSNQMKMKMMNGMSFNTSSKGLGDTRALALFKLAGKGKNSLNAQLGVSVPFGNIAVVDNTPMNPETKLAYPMQLGSGTWDPMMGVNYQYTGNKVVAGFQFNHIIRFNQNSEGYNLGDVSSANAWVGYLVNDRFNVNFGGRLQYNAQIQGKDADFNEMMMPLFNKLNSGFRMASAIASANYFILDGPVKNTRIGASITVPIWQYFIGTQMKRQQGFTFGLQHSIEL